MSAFFYVNPKALRTELGTEIKPQTIWAKMAGSSVPRFTCVAVAGSTVPTLVTDDELKKLETGSTPFAFPVEKVWANGVEPVPKAVVDAASKLLAKLQVAEPTPVADAPQSIPSVAIQDRIDGILARDSTPFSKYLLLSTASLEFPDNTLPFEQAMLELYDECKESLGFNILSPFGIASTITTRIGSYAPARREQALSGWMRWLEAAGDRQDQEVWTDVSQMISDPSFSSTLYGDPTNPHVSALYKLSTLYTAKDDEASSRRDIVENCCVELGYLCKRSLRGGVPDRALIDAPTCSASIAARTVRMGTLAQACFAVQIGSSGFAQAFALAAKQSKNPAVWTRNMVACARTIADAMVNVGASPSDPTLAALQSLVGSADTTQDLDDQARDFLASRFGNPHNWDLQSQAIIAEEVRALAGSNNEAAKICHYIVNNHKFALCFDWDADNLDAKETAIKLIANDVNDNDAASSMGYSEFKSAVYASTRAVVRLTHASRPMGASTSVTAKKYPKLLGLLDSPDLHLRVAKAVALLPKVNLTVLAKALSDYREAEDRYYNIVARASDYKQMLVELVTNAENIYGKAMDPKTSGLYAPMWELAYKLLYVGPYADLDRVLESLTNYSNSVQANKRGDAIAVARTCLGKLLVLARMSSVSDKGWDKTDLGLNYRRLSMLAQAGAEELVQELGLQVVDKGEASAAVSAKIAEFAQQLSLTKENTLQRLTLSTVLWERYLATTMIGSIDVVAAIDAQRDIARQRLLIAKRDDTLVDIARRWSDAYEHGGSRVVTCLNTQYQEVNPNSVVANKLEEAVDNVVMADTLFGKLNRSQLAELLNKIVGYCLFTIPRNGTLVQQAEAAMQAV